MHARTTTKWAALVGVIAAAVTLAAAEAASLLVGPASSPLFAVGSFVIDIVPPVVKDVTIALFGTADKIVLLVCLGIMVVALAAVAGVLEFRKPPLGKVVLGVVAAIALGAVLTREGAGPTWAIPTLVGALAGVLSVHRLERRLRAWAGVGSSASAGASAGASASASASPASGPLAEVPAPATTTVFDRRGFLLTSAALGLSAAVVGIGARLANAGISAANAVREALTLPRPVSAVAPIPVGAELDVVGISPLVSSNRDFYRIDTALQVPSVDASQWKLRVTGMVENELEIGFDELLTLPMIEAYVTLMCVSNEIGGDLTGNAKWLGHPIRDILARAKPLPGADMVLSKSIDGWTASTPLDVLLETDRDCLLAIGMNDTPLPLEHGFPARLVVPGLYGYVSATKWVVELKVTRFDAETAYWTTRGWSDRGPVKTSSRIDVPRSGAKIPSGRLAVAGVAWAQHVGIERVELRLDGDDWVEAELAASISTDTWVQWKFEWDAPDGDHTVQVRAIDANGGVQSGKQVQVAPNGAEGWHTVTFTTG